MSINEPIVLIKFAGNVKEKIFTLPYTKVATFEAAENLTYCVVSVKPSAANKSQIEKSVKGYYKNFGKIIYCNYSKNGIDIIQMTTNN